ncbi:hypothetical protein AAG570_001511 [Ranatra chinensis]|uniref:Uncharacterized protein n=1 Tax=Ranatra chinensis TaxID=642074 RepID=A0ABD0Y8Q4_9HEMI
MATCTRSKFPTSKTYSRKKYVYESDTDEEPQHKKKPGSRINKSVMEEQSEYEKIRLKNIEEREKMLQSLEFGELFNEMNALMPPTVTQKQADDIDSGKSGQVRKKKNIWADIERLTMRLRSMDEKRKPDDGFVEKTEEKPLNIDERILDTQPMELEEEYFDNFLGDVKSQLKNTRKLDPNIDLSSCDLRR